MNHTIQIFEAGSVASRNWKVKETTPTEHAKRFKRPKKLSDYSYETYSRLTDDEKNKLKGKAGCFVGGGSNEAVGPRNKTTIKDRSIVVLDYDKLAPGSTKQIIDAVHAIGYFSVVHSTAKHTEHTPKLHVLFYLAEPVLPNDYEPLARMLAHKIDEQYSNSMAAIDTACYRHAQAMYYPVIPSDGAGQYVYQWFGENNDQTGYDTRVYPLCNPYELLGSYGGDWKDNPKKWWYSAEESVPDEYGMTSSLKERKRSNPREIPGLKGIFNTHYSVRDVLEKFLYDIYSPADDSGSRYTYTPGSGRAGGVVYDGDLFFYSNHATDPASGKLLNAFELVQLHKFGHEDDAAKGNRGTCIGEHKDTRGSFEAMKQWLMADNEFAVIRKEYLECQQNVGMPGGRGGSVADAEEDFKEFIPVDIDGLLMKNPKDGSIRANQYNITVILENHAGLKGRIYESSLKQGYFIRGNLPWHSGKQIVPMVKDAYGDVKEPVREYDEKLIAGFYGWLEYNYGMTNPKRSADSAIKDVIGKHSYNEGKEFFDRLPPWDGVKRAETLMIDFLDTDDNIYVREVTRKMLLGQYRRVMSDEPLTVDFFPVLIGGQGTGKTTFAKRLVTDSETYTNVYGEESVKETQFSSNIRSFEPRELAEAIEGKSVVEISEMTAYTRSDESVIKTAFSSGKVDTRKVYMTNQRTYPYRCIFIGTMNPKDENGQFLKDTTGNRRVAPIECNVHGRYGVKPDGTRVQNTDLIEGMTPWYMQQVWAEVKAMDSPFLWTVSKRSGCLCLMYKEDWVYESPLLSDEAQKIATTEQTERLIVDDWQMEAVKFARRKIPEDFNKLSFDERMKYWERWRAESERLESDDFDTIQGYEDLYGKLVPREYICRREIWCEFMCPGSSNSAFFELDRALQMMGERGNGAKIDGVLAKLPEFANLRKKVRYKAYGGAQAIRSRVSEYVPRKETVGEIAEQMFE